MSASHTQGRLAVKHHPSTNSFTLYEAEKNWEHWSVAELSHTTQDAENARRLAVCWNIFDGIPTDQLQNFAPSSDLPQALYNRLAEAAIAYMTRPEYDGTHATSVARIKAKRDLLTALGPGAGAAR